MLLQVDYIWIQHVNRKRFVSARTKSCFDFERQSNYNISIRTTDSGGLFHDSSVQIFVTDINEYPVVVIPMGEEYKACGGSYAGQQAYCACANGGEKYQGYCILGECTREGIDMGDLDVCDTVECTRGLVEGFCVGCPLVFEDQDQMIGEDEFTKFECDMMVNGGCADSSDAEETGFKVSSDGRYVYDTCY